MYPYQGRLLVSLAAVGAVRSRKAGKPAVSPASLRVYELGKKRLLKKADYRNIPEAIVWMEVKGDRIFAGDMREGVHVFRQRKTDGQLYVQFDSANARWMTCGCVMDYNVSADVCLAECLCFFISRLWLVRTSLAIYLSSVCLRQPRMTMVLVAMRTPPEA